MALRQSPSRASGLLLLAILMTLASADLRAKAFDFPSSAEVSDVTLQKANQAQFRWTFLKIYDAALYLPEGVSPSEALSDVPKRLEFAYHRSLPADKIGEAGDKKLIANIGETAFAAFAEEAAAMNRLYVDIDPGDRYTLTYLPGEGTTLAHNGEVLGTVAGDDFGNAYFSIWLGENAVSESFRRKLLASK